jgi:hypothetical protein
VAEVLEIGIIGPVGEVVEGTQVVEVDTIMETVGEAVPIIQAQANLTPQV